MMRVLDFGRSFDYPTVATAKCRLQSCTSPPEQSNLKPWCSRSLTVTEEAKSEEIMIGMNVLFSTKKHDFFNVCMVLVLVLVVVVLVVEVVIGVGDGGVDTGGDDVV